MMKLLRGTIISPGIGIGKAYVINYKQSSSEAKNNISDFDIIKNLVRDFLIKLINSENLPKTAKDILEVQLAILDDPELDSKVKNLLNNGLKLKDAIQKSFDEYINSLVNSSEYFRERVIDIEGVKELLIRAIDGKLIVELPNTEEDIVIIANELDPITTSLISSLANIRGVILEKGGSASHVAILLRTMGIPAMFNVHGILTSIKNGDTIIIDSYKGFVYVNPSDDVVSKYMNMRMIIDDINKQILNEINDQSFTSNLPINVLANINSLDYLELALHYKANGIGLLRTEFLFFNRSYPPSEDEQYNVYKQIFSRFEPKTVIIRLLDVGGEKVPPYINIPPENNPQLGLRGIRLLLKNRELLMAQLRAIVRAAHEVKNKVVILIPMVSVPSEVKEVIQMVNGISRDLFGHDIRSTNIALGIMVETPAAAVHSDIMAKYVDLLSIGTNDLTQYTLAADRESSTVSELYSQFSPSVLRMINITVKNARSVNKNVEIDVCGAIASEPLAIPLLVGLGIDSISVEPPNLPLIYYVIKRININEATNLANEALLLESHEEVLNLVKKYFTVKNIKIPQVIVSERV